MITEKGSVILLRALSCNKVQKGHFQRQKLYQSIFAPSVQFIRPFTSQRSNTHISEYEMKGCYEAGKRSYAVKRHFGSGRLGEGAPIEGVCKKWYFLWWSVGDWRSSVFPFSFLSRIDRDGSWDSASFDVLYVFNIDSEVFGGRLRRILLGAYDTIHRGFACLLDFSWLPSHTDERNKEYEGQKVSWCHLLRRDFAFAFLFFSFPSSHITSMREEKRNEICLDLTACPNKLQLSNQSLAAIQRISRA